MSRIWTASIALSPMLVLICLAWLFFNVAFAVVFTALACFAAGYIARWLDEPAPKHSVRWSLFL